MKSEPVPAPDGEWDEGLAPERTQLAWGRTGLAVLVAVGVLARRVWSLHGGFGVVALVMVSIGALVWLVGMRRSRALEESMVPHGTDDAGAFRLVATGTVLLALGGLVFGVLLSA